jgi:hypothetical protein
VHVSPVIVQLSPAGNGALTEVSAVIKVGKVRLTVATTEPFHSVVLNVYVTGAASAVPADRTSIATVKYERIAIEHRAFIVPSGAPRTRRPPFAAYA